MKKVLFAVVALGFISTATSCGSSQKSVDNDNDSIKADSTEHVIVDEDAMVNENTEDETILGLVPGADYEMLYSGVTWGYTLYKDGSVKSTNHGDGRWHIESIHDKDFIVLDMQYLEKYAYIDGDHKFHFDSPTYSGYKLERINFIPDGAKDMEINHRYELPNFRWGQSLFLTLKDDGTVKSESPDTEFTDLKWKKFDVEGQQWILVFQERILDSSILVSPSLDYYRLGNRLEIKNGNTLVFTRDDWKTAYHEGKMK